MLAFQRVHLCSQSLEALVRDFAEVMEGGQLGIHVPYDFFVELLFFAKSYNSLLAPLDLEGDVLLLATTSGTVFLVREAANSSSDNEHQLTNLSTSFRTASS